MGAALAGLVDMSKYSCAAPCIGAEPKLDRCQLAVALWGKPDRNCCAELGAGSEGMLVSDNAAGSLWAFAAPTSVATAAAWLSACLALMCVFGLCRCSSWQGWTY